MTLTAGASFATGAVYNWELGPNNLRSDLLRVSSGNLAFGSSMVLNVLQFAGSQPIVGTDYVLLNYAGATLTTAAPTWTINYVSGGYYGASVVNDSGNSRFLLTGLLPEPGALTLLAAGAAVLWRRRR